MIRSTWRWLRQQSRRIYVRVILVAVLNVVALGIALVIGPAIPEDLAGIVGAEAVDAILSTIASTMLAVVTFSLTIMVTGFSRAEGQWTPRSHALLRQDKVTHSVLATFLGAFVYALIAMILRAADLFAEGNLLVLFATTILVVLWIVVAIIRWITHLDGYGGLDYTTSRIEARAEEALRHLARHPAQGAQILAPDATLPAGTVSVTARHAGYIEQVFEGALQDCADKIDAEIYVVQPVGGFVQVGDPLVELAGVASASDDTVAAIHRAIPIGVARTFEMDPIHSLAVLAEVAMRALSPGINDPNTAVDIAYRLARVLGVVAQEAPVTAPTCGRVWMARVPMARMFEVSFVPIARNAGTALEVHLALQASLASLARLDHAELATTARRTARDHKRRALDMIEDAADRARLEAVSGA